jgi:uncharacterized protein YoxC
LEQEIVELATSQGLYAVLFVALLFYVLRTTGEREKRAIEREEKLMSCLADLSDVRTNVAEIDGKVENLQNDVNKLIGRKCINEHI